MTAWQDLFPVFLSWLGRSSLQACLLIGLIVALQMVLRDRIAPRWRYGLWLILVAKLALPWAPASPLSLYNLFAFVPAPAEPGPLLEAAADVAMPMAADPDSDEAPPAATPTAPVEPSAASGEISPSLWQRTAGMRPAALPRWLSLAWLSGALCLALLTLLQALRLTRIRHQRLVTDQATLELLEDCKQQMGVPAYLAVVETPEVSSPALFGFVRPRLLLPAGAIASLGPQRLRHVFLHELAHLKRHDIIVNWLLALLQVLHWFNPLVWYAFARMRAERELACDALALSHAGAPDPAEYGRTIVDMLETFAAPSRQPGLAGVLEDKDQLTRRITMIARFNRNARRGSTLAASLLLVLACVALAAPLAAAPAGNGSLTQDQQLYADWTQKQFADILDTSQYADLSDATRAELETRWIAALNNPKGNAYYQAINNLAGIRSAKAVPPLLRIAAERREKDNRDRWMAVRALGMIGQDSVVPQLIPLTYHYNQNTRFWAQISLVKLTGQNFGADWQAWANWWNGQGKQPAAMLERVAWPCSNPEALDPAKQKETDAQTIARFKQGGEKNGSAEASATSGGGSGEEKAAAPQPGTATDAVRQSLRRQFELRNRRDLQKYNREQLREAEQLYQVANKNWRSPEAKTSLEQMIAKYPDVNRTGCAVLYMAQWAQGDERIQLLQRAIEKHGDCMYGDGVQVGAYARFYLAEIYDEQGQKDKATALYAEIRKQFPLAVNHRGVPLAQLIEASHPGATEQQGTQGSKNAEGGSASAGQPEDPRLAKKVTYSSAKASVQDIAQVLAKQAGLEYEWSKSHAQTDPACRAWVNDFAVRGVPLHEALQTLLEPHGLVYKLESDAIVLARK